MGSAFYRIHKSFLVNVSHIKEYSKEGGSFIVLKNGKKLTVSHRRKDKFAKEFLKTL
jgi:two-component system LytT family response regulator